MTPARRGKSPAKEKDQKQGKEESVEEPPEPKAHEKMTWAERLKRVFNIDITVCCHCGAAANIIACIADPAIITNILAYLDATSGASAPESQLPEPRAPPQIGLFG